MILRAGIPLGGVASISSEVTVSNSTSDTTILAYTLLAGWPTAGTILRVGAAGNLDSAEAAAATLSLWLKNNAGTKIFTETINTPDYALQIARSWWIELEVAFRTVGSSGTYLVWAKGTTDSPVLATEINYIPTTPSDANPADLQTMDTTSANTLTFGFNWSAANAGHVGRCKSAVWSLVRKP